MPSPSPPVDRLERLFHRRKCWMLAELAESLSCARITVRRLLNRIGYHRSYTHNGKWYVLRPCAQFNPEGLWFFKGIGFSKHGGLIETIEALLQGSRAGLSAGELGEKLQHPCHAVLTGLHKSRRLERLKIGGQFRYLSSQPKINERQREQSELGARPPASSSLSAQAAVLTLVQHLKHPALSFQQLAQAVGEQSDLLVTEQNIRDFFEENGLKKTPKPPTPKL